METRIMTNIPRIIGIQPNQEGVLDIDGDRIWTDVNCNYHREDGAAIEYANGEKTWSIHGEVFTKDEWIFHLKHERFNLDQKTISRLILENS